jgi:ribosomal protein S20
MKSLRSAENDSNSIKEHKKSKGINGIVEAEPKLDPAVMCDVFKHNIGSRNKLPYYKKWLLITLYLLSNCLVSLWI